MSALTAIGTLINARDIYNLRSDLDDKASQSDLTAAISRITALETSLGQICTTVNKIPLY